MNAQSYYNESVATGLFTFIALGKDGAGRRLYQKQLDGRDYGRPKALLSFQEYRAECTRIAREYGPSMGDPQRWVAETRADGTMVSIYDEL